MPTIDIDYEEFVNLLGLDLHQNIEEIDEVLAYAKGEVKNFDRKSGTLDVELKDTNRPDLWSIEGLVRTLRGFLNFETGLKSYILGKSIAEVTVDERLRNIRPYIACSIVKDAELSDATIRGIMQLQDKLDHTYGRNRRRTSIGFYEYDLIKPPLNYTVAKPTDASFLPLGSTEEMNLKEILEKHPKGIEYAHIVKAHKVFPILKDSREAILSFPPIINSDDLGKITQKTHNLLIEVTGTQNQAVLNTLKLVTLPLIDRGGKANAVTIHYPNEKLCITTPNFENSTMKIDIPYTREILGIEVSLDEVCELLPRARYHVKDHGKRKVTVQIPCYRTDIMHPVDIIEDIAIAYGYNKIKPLFRKLPTYGEVRKQQGFLDGCRELMVGLGFQEVLNYSLTNQENLFDKMGTRRRKTVQIENPKVVTLTCLRSWLLPGLMEFLNCNLHIEFPQRIFELGKITLIDLKQETRTTDVDALAAVTCHPMANFSEIKSTLDAFLKNLGVPWCIHESKHPSFISGRAGTIAIHNREVGIIGEISPLVLHNWQIENPVAGFEIDIEKLFETSH